jgi:hypothetical protein
MDQKKIKADKKKYKTKKANLKTRNKRSKQIGQQWSVYLSCVRLNI